MDVGRAGLTLGTKVQPMQVPSCSRSSSCR
jgi:hypothetical protein